MLTLLFFLFLVLFLGLDSGVPRHARGSRHGLPRPYVCVPATPPVCPARPAEAEAEDAAEAAEADPSVWSDLLCRQTAIHPSIHPTIHPQQPASPGLNN